MEEGGEKRGRRYEKSNVTIRIIDAIRRYQNVTIIDAITVTIGLRTLVAFNRQIFQICFRNFRLSGRLRPKIIGLQS